MPDELISGATDTQYVPTNPDDLGRYVYCRVRGDNALGFSTANSNVIGPIAVASDLVNTDPPEITIASGGDSLTSDTGTWTGSPTITHGYLWFQADDAAGTGAVAIPLATSATYAIDGGVIEAPGGGTAFTLISSVEMGSPDGNDFTTAAINTTGADLIVAAISNSAASGGGTGLNDSKGNTWIPLTLYNGTTGAIRMWYTVPTTVGSGHTFSVNAGGALTYSGLMVAAFSGAISTPFDAQNGSFGTSTAPTAGTITPAAANSLVVAAVQAMNTVTISAIGGGFTMLTPLPPGGGPHFIGALAYLVQTTAVAANPTWTTSASADWAAAIASFKSFGTTLLPARLRGVK